MPPALSALRTSLRGRSWSLALILMAAVIVATSLLSPSFHIHYSYNTPQHHSHILRPRNNTAPIPIGTSSDTDFVTQTNNTLQFDSLMSLRVVSNSTNMTMSADVAALTAAVGRTTTFSNGIEGICVGRLVSTHGSTSTYIGYPDIALINCDPDANTQGSSATDQIINYAVQSSDCVLLYSLHSNSCNFTSAYKLYASQMGLVLTTLSTIVAKSIVQSLNATDDLTAVITTIPSKSSSSSSSSGRYSTVPMAILYSITGLVAAIFLFIIISGAIRVHKHPERYGLPPPGGYPDNESQVDLAGGAAYSQRAKGLARAVLDSIPLVTVRITHKAAAAAAGSSATSNNKDPGIIESGIVSTHELSTLSSKVSEARIDRVEDPPSESQANVSSTTGASAAAITSTTSSPTTTTSSSISTPTPHYTYTTLAPPSPPPVQYPTTETLQPLEIPEDDDSLCPICFEPFADGEIVRVLPCRHRFHAPCVDPWLLNSSSQCPLCRVDLSIQRSVDIPDHPRDALNGESENNNANSSTTAAAPVIPEGYQIETSFFNRFLDVWNAHLLPKEARRAALARFHEEAELRRQLREQQHQQSSTTFLGNLIRPRLPSLSFVNNHGPVSSSEPSSADDDQNRTNWLRFVASRRYLHQLYGSSSLNRISSTSSDNTVSHGSHTSSGPGYYIFSRNRASSSSARQEDPFQQNNASAQGSSGSSGPRSAGAAATDNNAGTGPENPFESPLDYIPPPSPDAPAAPVPPLPRAKYDVNRDEVRGGSNKDS